MYKKLSREFKELYAIPEDQQDKFWKHREAFVQSLKVALGDYTAILALDAKQLIQLLAWCSSYRPMEPHSILTVFSFLNKKNSE